MDNTLDPPVELNSEQLLSQEENIVPVLPVEKILEPQLEKIETKEEIIEEELLPPEEKTGIVLFVLGSFFSVLIVVVVVLLGITYFKIPEQKVVVENVVPTEMPTPTEIPKIILKNEEITFEIINASGVAGTATKYKTKLVAKGYKVESMTVDSEKKSGLNVFFAKELDSQKEILLSDLKKEFQTINYSGEMTDSKNLVRIIIGR